MAAQVIPINENIADDSRVMTQGAYPEKDDREFVSKAVGWWNEADKSASNWLKNERGDHAFFIGHQWDAEDIEQFKQTNRVPLIINKTAPTIMVVSGHERANRMRVRYLPVEAGDTDKAEVWTEVARVVQEQGDVDDSKSECFLDSLKGGRGYMELRVDFTRDQAGKIMSECVKPWELRIDPTSSRYDLSDARYVIRAKDVSYEELLVMWPDKAEEILGANGKALSIAENASIADRDSDYDSMINKFYDRAVHTWKLLEVWYYQVEKTQEFAVMNSQTQAWEPVRDRKSLIALMAMDPAMQWERQEKYGRKYYQAFICGPVLLENNPSPYQQWEGFPYVPFLGLRDDETGRYVGMVNAMRDPQMEINKRRSQVLHILNQGAKSPWLGPQGCYGADMTEWEEKASKTGVLLEYTPNPSLPDSGRPSLQPPPQLPVAFVELEKMAAVDLRDVTGVNIELMGLSQKDTPGIVTNQRQKQALTLLQVYFDSLKRATKLMGRMLLALMQQYYTDGRAFQIIGKDGMQRVQQMGADLKAGKYDLVAEEAPYSPNQRMETSLKLQNIIQIALQSGIPVPPDVLDYLDLPISLTNKWKETVAQAMQAAEKAKQDPMRQLREYVDLDKLFPMLTVNEQAQVLQKIGIQPDMQGRQLKQQLEIAQVMPQPPTRTQ